MKRLLHCLAGFVLAWAQLHANAAPLFTATCSKLEGAKISPAPGKVKVTPDGHLAPILFIDSERPKVLVSLWTRKLFDKDTTDKYESVVISLTDSELQAVDLDAAGLSSYTLFFESGVLLYSLHRSGSIFSNEPNIVSFVAKCSIKKSQ